MRTTRVLPLALASVMALAATGCGADFKKDEPQTAVRDFLNDALARANGQHACDFMTQDAQKAFAALPVPGQQTVTDDSDSGQACRAAMERAALDGDKDEREVNTTGEVRDLDYSTKKSGEDATVTVKAKTGDTLTFKLSKRGEGGVGNLYEPKTPWRITGGAEPLVTGTF
ncbi:hypothetical protein [Patulibacter minatonensis]|uniref:hypothetical protein n=1 Tax=Patulibacter minatonensis TaxID=298163 RepID=UPI00146FB4CD|nr:hypothetical protein [Patulibacter minatonensis]